MAFSVRKFERVVAMFADELLVTVFVVSALVDRRAALRTVGAQDTDYLL